MKLKRIAYVGCFTSEERNARGVGIRVFQISEDMKQWDLLQEVPCFNPGYLAMDQKHETLYVAQSEIVLPQRGLHSTWRTTLRPSNDLD